MSLETTSQDDHKDPNDHKDPSDHEDPVDVIVQDSKETYHPDVDTSSVDERELMRRIDLHVVPWLAVLYLLNFLDRTNVGNAKLYNMTEDLHISDEQYLLALTVFFFPYSLLDPLSNIALKKLRPSLCLSSIILLWGIIMTLHGIVTNYAGFIALRVMLGVAEAGLYPGIIFYLSCWYKRNELGARLGVFISSATLAGAFVTTTLGGLLAAAIHNMDGIGGRPGWAWIFILEGLLTVTFAVASVFILSDFPDTAGFLSETERVWVVRRLQADLKFSAGGEEFQTKYLWQGIADPKTWLAMGIQMGFDGPLFAFSIFTPVIINQLGFQATAANLLSVPVYAWACVVTVFVGFLGDRVKSRAAVNLVLFGSGLVGYIILICSTNSALSYFAVYLAASSIYPTIPNTIAWVSSNIEGSYKRSVVLGMTVGWGNLNGAVSSNVLYQYRDVDKPRYMLGHGIILAYIAIGWLCSLGMYVYLKRENAAREGGARDEIIDGVDSKDAREENGRFESVEAAKREKGDQWSRFRYTL
ncbi:MFS general substrate transporter [Lenzites betulinus]|nr:MFS general substrate transporter [Lenzites betulinus]